MTAKSEGTVRSLMLSKIPKSFAHPQFNTDVVKPMLIENIIDQEVCAYTINLSIVSFFPFLFLSSFLACIPSFLLLLLLLHVAFDHDAFALFSLRIFVSC